MKKSTTLLAAIALSAMRLYGADVSYGEVSSFIVGGCEFWQQPALAPDDHEDPFVTMLYYPPALYDEASATGVLQLPDYVNPETGSFNDGLKINGVWELIAREPDADTNNPFS